MIGWPWFFGNRRNKDLDDEIAAHLAMAAHDLEQQGEAPSSAASTARRDFGNVALVKETTREMWGWRALGALRQDLRYAFRSLRGSPVFAFVAISSLALGIGANIAIFSFVNAILLKRLPVPEPERLVRPAEYDGLSEVNTVFSLPFLAALEKRVGDFDGVLGRFPVRVSLASAGTAEPLVGEVVTGSYYRTLRVKPALGRLLTEEDIDAAISNPVCVISYSTWQGRFGGDPAIVGRKLMLNTHPYSVIGVTERGFHGPSLQASVDLQLPVSRMGDFMSGFSGGPAGNMWKSAGFHWLEPLARLKPGVTAARAQAAFDPIARAIQLDLADSDDRARLEGSKTSYRLSGGSQGANYDPTLSEPVAILMAVVVLVLLIACANLAGLLLARANARARECAVRLSLGASRLRLVRQFMVESLLIALCGGLAGLTLAAWIVRTLLAYLNDGQPAGGGIQVSLDAPLIAFSVALTLLTAVLFGLVPAWQSTRPDVIPELKGMPGRTGTAARALTARRALIVFQIALSMVIVFTAGLLTRTLSGLKTIDLGFNAERVITLRVDPGMNGHSPAQSDRIFDDIVGRLRAHPGIAAASLAVVSPLEGSMISQPVEVPGRAPRSTDLQTNFNMVSDGYFTTLEQDLLVGRDFSPSDTMKAPRVAIVNKLFTAQYYPDVNPIGRRIKVGGGDVEIVGVVKNARYQMLREQGCPLVYLPARQTMSSGYALLVRTRPGAGAPAADIERIIRSVDSRLLVYDLHSLRDQIDRGMSAERVLSFLSSLFSALVTLLSSMGIYGLIAYAVSRRTREIGVRLAIGARKSDVTRLFLRESAILVAAGIVIGGPLALASAGVLKSMLYGVAPGDPMTLASTIAVFLIVGLLASLLPVIKAARISPSAALRCE